MHEIKRTIPTSLDDVPLNTYLDWVAIVEEPDVTQERLDLSALRLFAGITEAQSNAMLPEQRKQLLTRIYIALEKNPDYRPTFEHKGILYGMEPDFDEMTFGQFVDLDTVKDYRADLPKLVAMLYRPVLKSVGNTYSIEAHGNTSARQLTFRDIPASIALGALLFFWTIGKDCLSDTLNSIRAEVARRAHTSTSQKSGVGMHISTASLTKTSDELTTLLESLSTPFCFGFVLKLTWTLQINPKHELLRSN